MSWNDDVIAQFRAGHARIADMFDRDNLLLLHSTGAKSGQERIAPLAFLRINGTVYIVASAAGAPKHPDWYANVVAHPTVQVERWQGEELATEPMTAEVVPEGTERDELWARVVRLAPGFGEYQTKTTRVIPLIRLVPA